MLISTFTTGRIWVRHQTLDDLELVTLFIIADLSYFIINIIMSSFIINITMSSFIIIIMSSFIIKAFNII